MTADQLRRAAAKIRETAQAAAPGPWHAHTTGRAGGDHWYVTDADESIAYIHASDGEDEARRQPDAEHIALWSPDVAELVASALDGSADLYELVGPVSRTHPPFGLMAQAQNTARFRMLVLARRILGEGA